MTLSQIESEPSTSSRPSLQEAQEQRKEEEKQKQELREREKKRQRTTRPPAKQQKFSMDSDDDDLDDEAASDAADESLPPSPVLQQQEESPTLSSPEDQKKTKAEGPKLVISPLATVLNDQLRVWGPDGPVDKGDDTFFRTVGEWYTVVAPLVSLPALPHFRISKRLQSYGKGFVALTCRFFALYLFPHYSFIRKSTL